VWAVKRKHISAAFYKDKISQMLKMIINVTHDRVEQWKKEHVVQGKIVELHTEMSSLIMECVLVCVFGETSTNLSDLTFLKDGNAIKHNVGSFIRKLFFSLMGRVLSPLRLFSDFFDDLALGSAEKEAFANFDEFRAFALKMIDKRRCEIASGEKSRGDFLS
jgi:cytochrome P450